MFPVASPLLFHLHRWCRVRGKTQCATNSICLPKIVNVVTISITRPRPRKPRPKTALNPARKVFFSQSRQDHQEAPESIPLRTLRLGEIKSLYRN
jgi:hypothetical protein